MASQNRVAEFKSYILTKERKKIKEASVIVEQVIDDPAESGNRLRYQLVELAIYLGWPIAVTYVASIFCSMIWAGALGGLAFGWPILKGLYGVAVAKSENRDPRHFIRSSSFAWDGFLIVGSEALREFRKYGALSRSLDLIYNYTGRFGIRPEKFPDDSWANETRFSFINDAVKWWTDFWADVPIAQDVRSRLQMVADIASEKIIEAHDRALSRGLAGPIKVLVIAGGTNQDIVMALARIKDKRPEIVVEVTTVEPESVFSITRERKLIKHFAVNPDFFKNRISEYISTSRADGSVDAILKRNNESFAKFDVIFCIGLGDYKFGKKLGTMLGYLQNKSNAPIVTANVCGNFIERFFLHYYIQWPWMQYLSIKDYAQHLCAAYPGRSIKIKKTPHGIFNIAVIE